MKTIVVIGSGFGGLAAAIRLQARGLDVRLFEKRDKLGGRAYVYEHDGFTFDAGPTVITAPFLIEELFQLAGRRMSDHLTLIPLDPFYRIYFHDGRHFDYNNDEKQIEANIAEFNPHDVAGYRRFIEKTKAIFQKGFVELADRPFLRFSDMLRVAPDLIRLQSYRSVYSFVSQYIQHPLLRRVFTFHPLLVGGNPFQATSIYTLIHYLEKQWGVHYAVGGTGAIVRALGQVFKELGGTVSLNAEVQEILVNQGKACGVGLKTGETVDADAVVSNADVAWTYLHLIPPEFRRKYPDRKITRMRYSMSLFLIYFGTRRQYPHLAHHNIILSERYRELLQDIFLKKVLPEEFSLYLHRPTKTDPSLAPPGHDCFYALVPAPHLGAGIDWSREAPAFRHRVMNFLEQRFLPGLTQHLVTERLFTPNDFATELNSFLGSAFSVEPILTQSAYFRPHNRSEDIENLFFVGAGTHPGAGLPGVLSSAKIVDRLITSSQ
jgi:phytoene desaturase